MEGRGGRGNSGVVAFGSRDRPTFCGTGGPSASTRRLRSGSIASLLSGRGRTAFVASGCVATGIFAAARGGGAVFVLRPYAGRVGLVCCPASVRECWRIHCARAVLLVTGDDCERGRRAESRRDGRSVGSIRHRVYCDCRGAHAVRSEGSGAVELAAHSAFGIVSGVGGGEPVLA